MQDLAPRPDDKTPSTDGGSDKPPAPINHDRRNERDGHDEIEASKAPLMDHLIELRQRLIHSLIAFVIMFLGCFYFAKPIYNILVWPFVNVAGPKAHLIATHFLEQLYTNIRLAMFGAAFLSFPMVAFQVGPEQTGKHLRLVDQRGVVQDGAPLGEVAHQNLTHGAVGDRVTVDQLGRGSLAGMAVPGQGRWAPRQRARGVQRVVGQSQ